MFGLRRREIIDGIEVRGTAEFRRRTREALDQLKSLPQYSIIDASVAVIRQGRRSGMKAWAARPTFTVGSATWRHSACWAGDAEPCVDSWTGVEAEKLCLAFQRDVLAGLGADEKILVYIDDCAQNPTFQGRNKGWKSWLDYLRRWW
jgi:hypothetical protein